MKQVTRRLLAFVSIAGGGLLGAAPVAVAVPADPSPTPVSPPVTASDAPPSPAPAPDPAVRTGRSPDQGDPAGAPATVAPAPLDAASATVRTGRAADFVPSASPVGPPTPEAPSGGPAPVPSNPTPTGRTGATTSSPATHPSAGSGTVAPASSPVAAGPPPPDPTTHVTVDGESLWTIAAAQLTPGAGRPVPSTAEVTAYWQRLCDLNRPRLRSGDVNLIYPGEAIVLPPVAG
jgi:hypothetical protein